jgi:hypothetical protein
MSSKRSLVKYGLLGLLAFLFVSVNLTGLIVGRYYNSLAAGHVKRFAFPQELKINRIEFDPQGQMWVFAHIKDMGGMVVDSGVFVYKNGEQAKAFIGDQYPGHVLDFAFDGHGHVWAATLTNGIAYLENDKWKYITLPPVSNMILNITALETDAQGHLWVGTQGAGVLVWDGVEWVNHKVDTSRMAGGFINGIAFDSQGRAWVATSEGASLFDGKTWTKFTPENAQLATPYVNAVVVDSKDRAWFATEKGVHMFDGKAWKIFGDDAQDVMLLDKQDKIWVGSSLLPSRLAVIENDEYKRPTIGMIPAALAPDGRIWTAAGVSYSTNIPLVSSSFHQLHKALSFTNLLALSMVLILLGIGTAMEMWREMVISITFGALVYAASILALNFLSELLSGAIQAGAVAFILAAGIFTLGMAGGFFGLRSKNAEDEKRQNNGKRVVLTLIAFLFFLCMTGLCLSALVF